MILISITSPAMSHESKFGVESCWAQVQRIDGEEITAVVQTDLLNTAVHGVSFGDTINIRTEHALNIIRPRHDADEMAA